MQVAAKNFTLCNGLSKSNNPFNVLSLTQSAAFITPSNPLSITFIATFTSPSSSAVASPFLARAAGPIPPSSCPPSPPAGDKASNVFNLPFSVPTVYPLDKYARLSMPASLENLGIDRHFREEIRSVLDETYRWVEEYRFDKLNFARQKQAYCSFSAAATLFPPELSDARISWAKNGVLTTVVDDFFDVGGSEEELINLIQLVEKWDVNVSVDCCSENVDGGQEDGGIGPAGDPGKERGSDGGAGRAGECGDEGDAE